MTSGFNPHPKISFPLSLAAGVEGREEVAEFDLTVWMALDELEAKLRPQLPEGIELASVEFAPPGQKARVVEAVYEVRAAHGAPPEESPAARVTPDRVTALLSRDAIWVKRRPRGERPSRQGDGRPHPSDRTPAAGREVDIRPYLQEVILTGDALRLRFKVTPQGTARVQEVLQELGLLSDAGPCPYRIVRTRVVLDS